jgi:nucleoside-diphosphate-sugar epimerase
MSFPRILVTGVTGYIGGSILTTLQNSTDVDIKNTQLFGLVRSEAQANALKSKGTQAVLFPGLHDRDSLRKIASEYDVIIDSAASLDPEAAKALVLGLADRKNGTGKQTFFIHTSGTSNLSDRPISGQYLEPVPRVFSDKDDIYSYEKEREAKEEYDQRTTDMAIIDTANEVGVKTYIIVAPTIFGTGTGHFNKFSIQIPIITRQAIKSGQAEVIGEGKGEWDHVHIADLVLLYELILSKVLKGEDLPCLQRGIYFAETGRHTWLELSQGVAAAGLDLGALKTDKVKSVTLEEAARWFGGSASFAELAFASNSRTRGDLSREIGWKPSKTDENWRSTFRADFSALLKEQQA